MQTNSPSTESSSHLQTNHWSFRQNIEIIHVLSTVAVLVEVQGSHSLPILFLTLISGHIQHIQRQSILNIWLTTNDTWWNRFDCYPISLLAICVKRQIFSLQTPPQSDAQRTAGGALSALVPRRALAGGPGSGRAQGTSLSMKGMSLYLLSVTAHCLTACSRISRDSRCA